MNSYIALLFDAGTNADLLEGFFLVHSTLSGIEEKNNGMLALYLPSEEWTPTLQKTFADFTTKNPGIQFLGAEEILERNWNAEWEATVRAERVTPELIIAPSWRVEEVHTMASKYFLIIDPKMSFGTGHHETTRLCLQAIESLDVPGKHVLDLGTGTGVLAMYTLLRGVKHVIGIDTDHWSIENATENRTLNTISPDRFELRLGTLASAVASMERFDILLANLHRNLLIEHAEAIRQHSSPGASIILSGILMYDAQDVREAYEANGFCFVQELRENEWACLVFKY